MNPDLDLSNFSVQHRQKIRAISRRMEALNSLLNFFENNNHKNQTLADDCKAIADILLVDFENSVVTLLDLIEVEDEIE